MRRKEMKGSKKKNGRWRWLLQGHDAAAKSLQSCPTLCDPQDGSPPGSPVPGILQARTLEGLPFPSPVHESEKWKWGHSVLSDSSQPHGLPPTRLLRPWEKFQATVLEWDAIAFSVYRVIDNDKVRTDYSQAICFSKFLWLIWCGDSEVTKIESSVSDSMCPSNLFYFYFFALHTWAATAGEKSELGALLPDRTQEKW